MLIGGVLKRKEAIKPSAVSEILENLILSFFKGISRFEEKAPYQILATASVLKV